tara:strand:- start:44 stop:514 length:471 start_codon:yes stop_codon:yes gene_type:complete
MSTLKVSTIEKLDGSTFPLGKIGQIVQSVKNDATTITSTSYATTSFTASITPTATSSKILICTSLTIDNNSDMRTDATVYRGSTNLFDGVNDNSALISFNSIAEGRLILMQSNTYLDSPSSDDALTYTIYMKVQEKEATLRGADATSTITLMEVLA